MAAGAVANPTAAPQGPPPGVTLAPPLAQPPAGVTLAPPTAAPAPAAQPATPAAPSAPAAQTAPAGLLDRAKQWAQGWISDSVDENNPHPSGQLEPLTYLPVIGDEVAAVQRGVNKGVLRTVGGLTAIGARIAKGLGAPGDVREYMRQNPNATPLQARQAVAPEIYGTVDGSVNPTFMQQLRGTVHNAQPDFQTDTHRARVQSMMDTAKWFTDHADTQGFWEGLGSAGESIAEMIGGEGLLKLLPEAAGVGEAGKVVTLAEKLKSTQKVAQFLTDNPKIAQLVSAGMRTVHAVSDVVGKVGAAPIAQAAGEAGAAGGAQAFIKSGGDPDETAEGAAIGAAGGAAAHGIGIVGGKAVQAAKAGLERLGKPSATVDEVADAARSALSDRLEATNATRTAAPPNPDAEPYQFRIGGTPTREFTVGNISQDAGRQQVGTRVVAGKGTPGAPAYDPADLQKYLRFDENGKPTYLRPDKYENVGLGADGQPSYPDAAGNTTDEADPSQTEGSHKEPIYQYRPTPRDPNLEPGADRADGGGTLLTKDPKVASSHLASLESVIGSKDFDSMPPAQKAGLLASRDDIKQQLGEFYRQQKAAGGGTPNFSPVDVQQAIGSTGNFADAADSLHSTAAEVYEHANNVTGGQWQALDQYIGKLQDKLGDTPFTPERTQLRGEIAHAQSVMSEILDNPSNGFDANDVSQAKKNFRAKYVLQDAHQAIKPIYAIEQQAGTVTGQYRGVNGSMLGQRWDEFMKANPDARSIIGGDRADTLREIFRQNETLASRKRFGSAVLSVSSALAGYHFGGLVGAAEANGSYQAIKYVLNSMVSNPKVAKNILFAIDSGARPDNYGRAIAQMIVQGAKRYGVPAAAGAIARSN